MLNPLSTFTPKGAAPTPTAPRDAALDARSAVVFIHPLISPDLWYPASYRSPLTSSTPPARLG